MSDNKPEINCGCFGCLGPILIIWLLFYGGCGKLNEYIDSQIAANKAIAAKAEAEAKQAEKPK